MQGLARTGGMLFRALKIGEKEYRLAPPRLADLAALEAELLAKLPDPIEQAAKAALMLPVESHGSLFSEAFKASQESRRFDLSDMDKLPMTVKASASAFLTLRRHHADEIQTLDDALAWLERASEHHSLQELAAITEAAAQETPPKKSPEAEASET